MLSSDHFSNYLKRHDEKTLSANCFIEVHKQVVPKECQNLGNSTLLVRRLILFFPGV